MIRKIEFSTGAASGSAGSATSNSTTHAIFGEIVKVYVDFQGSPPAGTCDFTLTAADDPASENIVTITDSATDAAFYPRRVLETNDGTDLTYDGSNKVYGPYVVASGLTATIAQVNAADYADVIVWYRV